LPLPSNRVSGTTSPGAKLDVKSQINIQTPGDNSLQAIKATYFGYSNTYRVTQIGAGTATVNDNLAIGVDLSGNPSGAFTGSGEAIYFRNGITFRSPNSTNDGYNSYMTLKDGNVTIAGTLTVNGNQTGAADHVFDDYDDIELLRKWRKGESLPFETGDILNRDRLLHDAVVQLAERVHELEELVIQLTPQKR